MNDYISQEIHLDEVMNVLFWCEELSVGTEELNDIVSDVGTNVHEVREYLAKKLMASWPAYY
jgi:hypothetical protein